MISRWLISVWVWALLLPSGTAAALSVQIAWQVPLSRTERYVLEVARDPGFGDIVHTTEVAGSGLIWNAPGEGVYHWRLARPRQKDKGGEVITFVSGSFAAIDPKAQRQGTARLSWDKVEGADRYKLYVLDDLGHVRTMISTATWFVVPQSERELMIEVIPYTGETRTYRGFQFNPSLKLDSALPPPPPPPPPAPPVTAAAQAATESETERPRRVHLVHFFGLYEREELRLQKLDIDLNSQGGFGGFGAGFWSNPTLGLVVAGQGAYHEHEATLRQEELFADGTIALTESRHTAELTVGWNLLDFWDVRRHVLVLAAGAATMQLPYLPLQYAVAPTEPPVVEVEVSNLLGGSLAYGWFGQHLGFLADGGYFVAPENDISLQYQRLLFEMYLLDPVAIHLGAFHRVTRGERCHPDTEVCLAEGAVRTSGKEAGGFLGLGIVLR